jgi:hypothetical protein
VLRAGEAWVVHVDSGFPKLPEYALAHAVCVVGVLIVMSSCDVVSTSDCE